MPRKRRSYSRKKEGQIILFIIGAFIIVAILTAIKDYLPTIGLIIAIIAIIVIAFLIYRRIKRSLLNKKVAGELQSYLLKALEAMDSTARTYTNEEEANKELVATLKVQGLDVQYQFPLGQGYRYADAKVGNAIIEGKLAPTQDEVHRLLGQIQGYSEYPYQLYVVIYGFLNKYAIERISQVIRKNYPEKVFLTYLSNPRRRRA